MPVELKYCKAYPVEHLAQYPGWNPQNLEHALVPDVVFLHENLVVTTGIYPEENIVFSTSEASWRDFCEQTLDFKVPGYESSATS